MRANRIHDNKQSGVYVHEQGRGTFEDNDISANTKNGVEVNSSGDPTIRNNKIHHNHPCGIRVPFGGGGTITGNNVFSNTPSNLKISSWASVTQNTNRTADLSRTTLRRCLRLQISGPWSQSRYPIGGTAFRASTAAGTGFLPVLRSALSVRANDWP